MALSLERGLSGRRGINEYCEKFATCSSESRAIICDLVICILVNPNVNTSCRARHRKALNALRIGVPTTYFFLSSLRCLVHKNLTLGSFLKELIGSTAMHFLQNLTSSHALAKGYRLHASIALLIDKLTINTQSSPVVIGSVISAWPNTSLKYHLSKCFCTHGGDSKFLFRKFK